jgi:membrane dipeptidase
MLVDISHVSDETMRDVLAVSDAPVIASHSAARGVATGQPRDVPDDVLRMIHGNGGVVMVNFFSGYLIAETPQRIALAAEARERILKEFTDGSEQRAAWRKWLRANPVPRGDVKNVADHINHIARIAGINHVGIGSDYDGVSVLPEGLEDVSCFPNLTAELLRRGYSEADVKKVLGGNILRVMREAEEIAGRIQIERPPSIATTQPATLLKDLRPADPRSADLRSAEPRWRDLPPSRPAAAR